MNIWSTMQALSYHPHCLWFVTLQKWLIQHDIKTKHNVPYDPKCKVQNIKILLELVRVRFQMSWKLILTHLRAISRLFLTIIQLNYSCCVNCLKDLPHLCYLLDLLDDVDCNDGHHKLDAGKDGQHGHPYDLVILKPLL